MTVKKIKSGKDTLDARVYCREDKKPDFATIFTHGFLSSVDSRTKRGAKAARNKDYLGVAFSFTGQGKSTGVENFYSLESQERDIVAIMDYIANEYGTENMLLSCSSLSAISGLKVASEDKRVKGISLTSPQTTFRNVLSIADSVRELFESAYNKYLETGEIAQFPFESKENGKAPSYLVPITAYSGRQVDGEFAYTGMKEANPLEYASRLRKPVQIIMGTYDDVIDPDSIVELYQVIPKSKDKRLIQLGDTHRLNRYKSQVTKLIFSFFDEIREKLRAKD